VSVIEYIVTQVSIHGIFAS